MSHSRLRAKSTGAVSLLLLLACVTYGTLKVPFAMAVPYGAGGYGNCLYGSECSISLTTSGTVSVSLTPAPGGSYSIQEDPVVVDTKNPFGYILTLESNSASTAALVNGSNTLSAVSGSPSSPVTLSSNSWGYRIDGRDGFGAGPTSATNSASSSSLLFAGLPLNGSPQTIYSSGAASANGGDTIDVWYGVRADTTVAAGSYLQTIVYTAIATP